VKIHRLPALTDNYMWLVVDESNREAIVVDPSEAAPVIAKVAELGVKLTAIWCTHHHHDHVGGNEELVRRFPGITVVGSTYDGERGRIPGQTVRVSEGDQIAGAHVLDIPGHTLGHVAYVMGHLLFCGDTLFGGGCGRLFEGTPAMMVASLGKLRELPDDTRVHCGHEYTWHNVRFAAECGIEPDDPARRARHERLAADPTQRTVPTLLAEEKATNPFLRWDAPGIIAWTGKQDPIDVFAEVRGRKDRWKA
jgi:hydroxyacylglutathione hydrolase